MPIEEITVLKKLSFKKQLTFAYLTCERLYPNYSFFSDIYNFGNPDVLRKALDFLHQSILRTDINKNRVDKFITEIDNNIPDPAHYPTVLASAALDACTALNESLDFLMDQKPARLDDIVTMATDTVDMYIQEKDKLDPTDVSMETKIQSHPLMTKEISMQKKMISYLNTVKDIGAEELKILLSMQENNKKGNLNL